MQWIISICLRSLLSLIMALACCFDPCVFADSPVSDIAARIWDHDFAAVNAQASGVEKQLLSIAGSLTEQDPKDKVRTTSFHKVHRVKMLPRAVYTIILTSNDFDSFLRLEDENGKEVASDDDGAGNRNARIVYKSEREAEFRVIVTTFAGAVTGKYELIVRQAGGISPEHAAKILDRDKLLAAVEDAKKLGKLPEALSHADKALRLEREIFGPDSVEAVQGLDRLLGLHVARKDLPGATKVAEESLAVRRRVHGEKHLEYADGLETLAWLHVFQQNLATAEPLTKQALALREPQLDFSQARTLNLAIRIQAGLHGTQNTETKRMLLQLHRVSSIVTQTLVRQQQLSTAKSLWQMNLALLNQAKLADHWLSRDAATALATLERLARCTPDEQKILEEGIRADTSVQITFKMGNYTGALADAERSLSLRRDILGPTHADYSLSLNNLGMVHQALQRPADAMHFLRRAWLLRKDVYGPDHPLTAMSLNNLGQVYYSEGDYVQAEICFRKSLDILQELVEPKHAAHIAGLNNLAVLYQAMGDPHQAAPLLTKAYALFVEAKQDPPQVRQQRDAQFPGLTQSIAGTSNWSGSFYSQLHYRGVELEDVIYLGNLGRLHAALDEPKTAESYFKQALDLLAELEKQKKLTLYVGHQDHQANAFNNLGLFYITQGQLEKASDLLLKALDMRKAAFPRKLQHADGLNNLAFLRVEQGRLAEAESLVRESLDIYAQILGGSPMAHANGLSNLALILDRQGKSVDALSYAKQGALASRDFIDRTAAAQSERQQLAMLETFRGQLDLYLSIALRSKAPADDVHEMIRAWRGSVFARQQRLRERRLAQDPGREKIARVMAEQEQVTRQLAFQTQAFKPDAKVIAELSARKEILERTVAEQLIDAGLRPNSLAMTSPQFRKSMPANVVLVEYLQYLRGPSVGPARRPEDKKSAGKAWHFLAVVVRSDQPAELVDLGPAEPIGQLVQEWRSTLKTRADRAVAARLRDIVWDPVEKKLPADATVLIAPDGVLNQMPFAALPGRDMEKYLIEERAVSLLAVPQLLPEMLKARNIEAAKDVSMLLVGDVDFDAAPSQPTASATERAAPRAKAASAWTALPGTRAEMLMIRDTFEQKYPFPDGLVFVLRGPRATEANLREHLGKHRWLHLATHGFYAHSSTPASLGGENVPNGKNTPNQPRGIGGYHPGFLSGVVLAGANQSVDPALNDGILTALEVAELDLRNVDLAVLSACETGLGQLVSGEGALGLQRSFHLAGARTVVASLWQVPDQPTSALMEKFYANLWDKKQPRSKLEALRQAQIWMLREGPTRGIVRLEKDAGPRRAPPYYWAAFVLSGDWR